MRSTPRSHCSKWSKAAVIPVLVVATMAACSDDSTEPPSTTTAATTTAAVADPTTTKTPAATVNELVTDLYAALNSKDDAAFRALSTDDAYHGFFYDSGAGRGMFPNGFDHDASDLAHVRTTLIEVVGEPLVSGNAVAIPVRYTHPNEVDTGFDLLRLESTPDGFLIAGGVTLYAAPDLTADPATAAVVAAEAQAWNDDDVTAVVAMFDPAGSMWSDVSDLQSRMSGAALQEFVSQSLWFDVEVSADLAISGPFAAAATRLVATGDTSDGITIYLIRDGLIVLQAFAQ